MILEWKAWLASDGTCVFKRMESSRGCGGEQWGLDNQGHSCVMTSFLSSTVLGLKPLPISLPFHFPPRPQMGWLRSAPSWRRSSVKRTWSSGWPVRSSRRPGQLQNWSPRPIGSLKSLWMCRLRGRCVGSGVLSDPHPLLSLLAGVWARFDGDFLLIWTSLLWWLWIQKGSLLRCRAQGFYKKELYWEYFSCLSVKHVQQELCL